jgi:hypothetical protein
MGVGSCLQVYGLSALPDEPRNFHEEGFSDVSYSVDRFAVARTEGYR